MQADAHLQSADVVVHEEAQVVEVVLQLRHEVCVL